MSDNQIINKYRPVDFNEIIGHTEMMKSLSEHVASPTRRHTYLFTGPAGVGKTTLARIIASKVDAFITEVNCGADPSVEFTRDIVSMAGYRPITDKPNRMLILDECHAFSKQAGVKSQAWSPLLKLTEEPPDFLYVAFCTTELDKIPDTIRSRAFHCALRPLKANEIDELVTTVAELEGWPLQNEVANSIILAADGSARLALTILDEGHRCQTKEELSLVVQKVFTETSPEIEICRYLMSGKRDWRTVAGLLSRIDKHDEAITNMAKYFAGSIVRSEEQQAHDIWILLQKLMRDVTWDKRVQLYSAVGSMLWGSIPF